MRAGSLATLALLAACVSPPAVEVTTGVLRGSLDTSGADAGNGFVFLYPAGQPPAPAGNGRPVQVTGVPEPRLFEHQRPDADFVFSGLTPGHYLARGMIDVRHTFDPFVDVMAQPFAEDFDAPLQEVTAVAGGTARVALPPGRRVEWDPPMFVVDSVPDGGLFTLGSNEQVLSVLHLRATPLPFAEPSQVAFVFSAVVDGGLLSTSTYPEVVLERVPEDTDGPEFKDENGQPLQIVLPATTQPDPAGRNDLVDGQQVVNGMYVLIPPIAEVVLPPDASGHTRTRQLPSIPGGIYQITVLEADGRYWQVPNGLAPGQPFASNHGGPYASQGPRFVVVNR
jgi:hypothetical protein